MFKDSLSALFEAIRTDIIIICDNIGLVRIVAGPLTTEAGDYITTESGDIIIQE